MIQSSTDKPARFPTHQVNGQPLKPLTQVLLDRRATQHFKPDPVPDEYLEAVLRFAGQAPSGYNLQPWRFIIVRDPENRKRLCQAAYKQLKVAEAPVVIIAFAIKGQWRTRMDAVFQEGVRRGAGKAEDVEKREKGAADFVDSIAPATWLNRHVMIAFTTMMLMAEAYGLDTAPMEGFDPEAVKKGFGLPEGAEVMALLAIGYSSEPDRPYGGRLPAQEIFYEEHYSQKAVQ